MNIRVTVNNTVFYIPRDVLEKSDFFRGMLEISNDLVINNPSIDMNIFKVFVSMINNTNVTKQLVELYDMLSFDCDYEAINMYYCKQEACNKIPSTGAYCDLHKCVYSDCSDDRYDKSDYCEMHKCIINDCLNNIVAGTNYCCYHAKCQLCDQLRKNLYGENKKVGWCNSHSCCEPGCYKQEYIWGYCYGHYR